MDANEIFQKGTSCHQNGQVDKAINYYKEAIRIAPNMPAAHFHLGIAMRDVGKISEAISSLQNTIKEDPNYYLAYYDLGNILYTNGHPFDSIDYFLRAIEVAPHKGAAHNNLNVVLENINSAEKAMKCYRRIFNCTNNLEEVGPLRIRIETSSACNLRCQHCLTGTDYNQTGRGIMDLNVFDKIITNVQPPNNIRDCFMYLGGEPLLNKHLSTMCSRIKKETSISRTLFNTNGMLIDSYMCNELASSNVDQISVSIDGRSPEENNTIRRGSDYNTLIENVYMMHTAMPNTTLAIWNILIKRLHDPDTPEVPDFLNHDFPQLKKSVNYAMAWPGFKAENSSVINLRTERLEPDMFCIMPFTNLVVKSNGDITLCCYDILGEHVMGNIYTDDLFTIWTSSEYRELRYNMLEQNVAQLPAVCRKCKEYTGAQLLIAA